VAYSSLNIISIIKSGRLQWAEHVARTREVENAYKILDGKPEEKRTWETQEQMNYIATGLKEMGCG
jgi:hypothetical protein